MRKIGVWTEIIWRIKASINLFFHSRCWSSIS